MALTKNQVKFVANTGEEIIFAETSQYSIRQTLGVRPYMFGAPFHSDDISKIDTMMTNAQAAGTSVFGKLVITTSDDTPDNGRTVEWLNWILLRVDPDSELDDIHIATFADIRYQWLNAKISKKYNTYYSDGLADLESLNSGTPWDIYDYIEDLIDQADTQLASGPALVFGGEYFQSSAYGAVPRNLGNTRTDMGGWSAATIEECTEAVFKALNIDFIVGFDGAIYITDTISERADLAALSTIWMEGSFYRDSDTRPQTPLNLKTVFEVRSEVAMQNLSGATSSITKGLVLDNVLQLPSDPASNFPSMTWELLLDWFAASQWANLGLSIGSSTFEHADGQVAGWWFLDEIIGYLYQNGSKTPSYSELTEWMNNELVANWRRAYRVSPYAANERHWCNIRLGRITEAGGTSDAGCVFCDYIVVRRRGIYIQSNLADGTLGNFEYANTIRLSDKAQQPAPLSVTWVDPEGMILRLTPRISNPAAVEDVVVGRMNTPTGRAVKFGFNTALDLALDADPTVVQLNLVAPRRSGTILQDHDITIIGNASPTSLARREYIITSAALPDGVQPTLRIKAYGVTANYAFSDAQMAAGNLANVDAEELLNAAELQEIADKIYFELLTSLDQTKLGAIKVGGTEPFESGLMVGGECNEMWIEVGAENGHSFSVTTNYSIRPGQIKLPEARKRTQGDPVRLAVY